MHVELLVIDPQNSFCDKGYGTVCVPGADKDMKRLAKVIKKLEKKLIKVRS